ncbi:MAG: FIST N-terminal domain-containing protein [Pseudomonadota bacterium]
MKIATAYSQKNNTRDAVADISAQLKSEDIKLVVFFASSAYEPDAISRLMDEAFPGAEVLGCSTAGEIISGHMFKNALVVMAFNSQAIKSVKVQAMENLGSDSYDAFSSFEQHFGRPMSQLEPDRYVGIILIDGLSCKEELIIDRMGDLTNVNFIGGSAGDDLKFAATHVYAKGKSYKNAAVLALIEPVDAFEFIKTQSFCPTDKMLLVTKANEFTREVLEFNHKPASQAYAEALNTTVADASSHFMHNPVGLVFEGEPFVRSPQQIKGDSMVFYCSVMEGMELTVLESTDIIKDTCQAISAAQDRLGNISGIINFNCILRTLEMEQKGLTTAYGELFKDIPTIGFSTYGEQFIGHVNQTATMLVFK